MKTSLFAFTTAALLAGSASAAITITGYYDGNFSSDSTSRALEIYTTDAFTLGDIRVLVEANGGSSWSTAGSNFDDAGTNNGDTVTAGNFFYFFDSVDSKNLFAAQFGITDATDSGTFSNGWQWTQAGGISGNGNDAFQIQRESDDFIYDQIGDPSDTTPWEHEHDYMYRNDNTGPDGASFTLSDWTISSGDVLSGEDSTLGSNFPAGTYIPEPGSLALLGLGGLLVARRRRG